MGRPRLALVGARGQRLPDQAVSCEARRLADASAQYNEGSRRIHVNVPTMPLADLAPMRLAGLRVSGDIGVTEKIRGLDVVVVEFSEAARPR